MSRKWVIYRHICKVNGKSYIGITCQKPEYRWGKGSGYAKVSQPAFYNAIKKYGWENFEHQILEENISSQKLANKREKYWIAYYHTWVYDPDCNGYNITQGGEGHKVGHNLSIEARQKMSAAKKGKPGHKLTAEARNKISESKQICGNGHTGKKYVNNGIECYCVSINEIDTWLNKGFVLGRLTSQQAKANIAKSFKKVYCVELDKIFDSITQAANELNLQISKISLCCSGKRNHTGGYHFKFIEE